MGELVELLYEACIIKYPFVAFEREMIESFIKKYDSLSPELCLDYVLSQYEVEVEL